MQYQLVLQFAATQFYEYESLVALEEELIHRSIPFAEIDGHDFGLGEYNIFVLTDKPEETFRLLQKQIDRSSHRKFKAAYRECDKDDFTTLWPEGLDTFSVA